MRTFWLLLTLCVSSAAGCESAAKTECSKGWSLCDGTCKALLSDEANCGTCGSACAGGTSCVAGACAPDCTSQLLSPLPDPWGNAWDGNERPAADLASASAACEAIGGRLPSLSELDRVSAKKTGAVADVYRTNVIRALTPADSANTMAIRLSDGTTSTVSNGTPAAFRCVCPAVAPESFSGGACQGAPGSECYTHAGEATLAVDAQDRPAASKAAAIWDCAFSGGQLASAEALVSAILSGLPNGSAKQLHTADQMTGALSTRISWTDSNWTAAGTGSVGMGSPTDLLPFRCTGPRSATRSSAASLTGGVLTPAIGVVIDGADHASGETRPFADAVGACFAAGGHLPTGAELAAAAMQGVPRAESALMWAGDEVEGGTAALFGWTGTAYWQGLADATVNGISFVSPTTIGGSTKAAALPYRCLYPAVDTSYAGPAASDCNGSCTLSEASEGRTGTPARTWIDGGDRAPATYETATSFCASLGGHVASARDLVEGIRNGLPGSAGATPEQVLTSDLAASWEMIAAAYTTRSCSWGWCGGWLPYPCETCTNVVHPAVYDWRPGQWMIRQWTGNSNPTYDDSAGSGATIGTSGRFRCVWTNEIR